LKTDAWTATAKKRRAKSDVGGKKRNANKEKNKLGRQGGRKKSVATDGIGCRPLSYLGVMWKKVDFKGGKRKHSKAKWISWRPMGWRRGPPLWKGGEGGFFGRASNEGAQDLGVLRKSYPVREGSAIWFPIGKWGNKRRRRTRGAKGFWSRGASKKLLKT